jgi:hypothetical protein
MKTSIKIKKFWYSELASDGGVGVNWKEIQLGQRESSVQYNGSDASVTNYKNVVGNTLQSAMLKGDKTVKFQLADLTPAVIADFTGGTVTTTVDSVKYEAPENENQSIEKSVKFLTDNNVLVTLPRVSLDGYPMFNDDDLHYFQMNGTVLKPEKTGVKAMSYEELLLPAANDILTFALAAQSGAATISAVTHTVAITVVAGTVVSALMPTIGVSPGASITPESGAAQNFTAPFVYSVEAANGTKQSWTVTVTVAV